MREVTQQSIITFFFFFLIFFNLIIPSMAGDSIIPTKPLKDGKTLISSNETFELGFFSGNSNKRYVGIWYHKIPTHTNVWVANRDDPIINDRGGVLRIDNNGNLVLIDGGGNLVWSSKIGTNSTDSIAQIRDDGNLVLTDGTGSLAWQSFDHPTDTILPGMKVGWDRRKGPNRSMISWRSPNDPSSGDYKFYLDIHGSPQFMLRRRSDSVLIFRTGPWNGLGFSGVPDMKIYSLFHYEFVQTKTEAYFTLVLRSDVKARLILQPTGVVEKYVWVEQQQVWNEVWATSKDQCDKYGACGPNGLCNTSDVNVCDCLRGFKPKSTLQDWYLRVGSDGCVRKTELDCGGDAFVPVSGVKVPDTSNSTVYEEMSLDACGKACAKECSCTAYATANISSGRGCLMWFGDLLDTRSFADDGGQVIYLRLAASEINQNDEHHKKKWIGIIVVAVVVLSMLLLGSIFWFLWKKKSIKARWGGNRNVNYSDRSNNEGMDLPLFDLDTLEIATNNFSDANKIGEGGFGLVYKGNLEDDQEIAVKRLSRNSTQGLDEFKNEVVLIAKLQHRNLVRLLGCCVEEDERMLIYEYMPNKSLDTFLFDVKRNPSLNWRTRHDIIMGIARGIVYLHQDSRFRIIHRDLKASNILLDKEMNPKISDFGMARIFRGDHGEANTRRVVGTYGYMSPEYAMDGVFSVKSDVFSFGVLILEILSGKKNRGVYELKIHLNLLAHAWHLWTEGNALELLDASMDYSWSKSKAMRCIHVGLLCVQERAEDRPTMPYVVTMLSSDAVTLPPPRQPGFYTKANDLLPDWPSMQDQESCSINEVTVTMIDGR
ncbi:Receptor-like serine/threonine-protein kinase SD1-8 [Acorus calamus]|uniref:Receptor-like serine/threonine-protein kinase n=1 Tax=Acorus calamus TaxID=4465 RepID=A0AAV9DWP8_ACOCL|nr:Receptor-like serine/threonine-protein kinase SD1-8 [Acorus calamus]